MFKIFPMALTLAVPFGLSACAAESTVSENWIADFDDRMQVELESNNIPGMAVALVDGNKTVFSQTYGLRDVENNIEVDENTLFHIASTHKSLTSMLIATLVDDNVVAWDTPVVEYYSDFQLASAASTDSVTLTHLLSMSSGISASAEDLLPETPAINDVFRVAKESTLLGAPLEEFSYSNISTSIAGYVGVIAKNGSNETLFDEYANTLKSRVLDPIGMTHSTLYASDAQQSGNLSKAYQISASGESVLIDSRDVDGDVLAPSGSLKSNIQDMALYLNTQLNDGVAPNDNQVVSAENLRKTKQPILDDYAMGWESINYKETEVLMHTGSFDGFVSVLVLIPVRDTGLVLLANSESGEELTDNIYKILLDIMISSED
ncbi:MAG: serine hydrolase domain-containing protein [Oleispira sp.]